MILSFIIFIFIHCDDYAIVQSINYYLHIIMLFTMYILYFSALEHIVLWMAPGICTVLYMSLLSHVQFHEDPLYNCSII